MATAAILTVVEVRETGGVVPGRPVSQLHTCEMLRATGR